MRMGSERKGGEVKGEEKRLLRWLWGMDVSATSGAVDQIVLEQMSPTTRPPRVARSH